MIIGGQGLGDCILSLQCGSIVQKNPQKALQIYISAISEICASISHLFGHLFDLNFIPDQYSKYNRILREPKLMFDLTKGFDEVYYVVPSLAFFNQYSFDFEKYNCFPQSVREIRLLVPGPEKKKIIYVGLLTTKHINIYSCPISLILKLAEKFPDYTIYFPVIKTWAGRYTQHFDLPKDIPKNLMIDINPDINNSFDILLKSCYFIGTDNAPSHIAYQAGIPRLILDSMLGWPHIIVRWREDLTSDSIPITTSPDDVVKVTFINLSIPQTIMLPRTTCLKNKDAEWKSLLYLTNN